MLAQFTTESATKDIVHGFFLKRTCSFLRLYGNQLHFRGETTRNIDENASLNLDYAVPENRSVFFHFVHVYKIRYTDNSSLVANFLGSWNPDSWSLRSPISVKLRNDFKGAPIVFGILNGSIDGQIDLIEEEVNDITPLLDFAIFVTNSVNASIELIPHEKLGTLNNKGWSNLFGDVVTGIVDIGLGYITVNEERQAEMSFSHPLIRYMRNIYYYPLETGTMRDIFRQPFNNYLLGCVACTYIAIVVVMGLIIYVAKSVLDREEEKRLAFGEAALWCISIMCMQGSPWTPRNASGKTVLLFSLMFALVMYNAYAGFITSILSVQASGIKSITDILSYNFKLGYSKTDDEYIRNANDSNLRELYIRAFNNRESRLNTTYGLQKAVKGNYGFFVSATLARRALRSTLFQDRCSLRELTLPQTFTMVALPMAKFCPYKKIINLNILKIRERGVLHRITERMLPEMPRCQSPTTFHSARPADVYSAFFILIAGGVSAMFILLVERIWSKRQQMRETIICGIRDHPLISSHLPNFSRCSSFTHFSQLSHFDACRNWQCEFSCNNGSQVDLTNSNELIASTPSVCGQNFSDYVPGRRNEDGDLNPEVELDRLGYESKFFRWRRKGNLKRVNRSPFYGLHRKKLCGKPRVTSRDNVVFPFHP